MTLLKNNDFYRQEGFTLIEIIIALFIFAIGILAVTLMQTTALSNTKVSLQRSIATSWITSQMEQSVLSTSYETLADATVSHPPYTVSWNVEPEAASSKNVHVTVSWQENSTDKSVTFDIIRVKDI